jgi:lipoprotein NlpD
LSIGKNKGIDIKTQLGEEILAAKSGKVSFVGEHLKGYGQTIIIEHPNEFTTVYAHIQKIIVRPGDFVKRGEIIAYAGNTGRTNQPMLHFEVRKKHIPCNPLYYLP